MDEFVRVVEEWGKPICSVCGAEDHEGHCHNMRDFDGDVLRMVVNV